LSDSIVDASRGCTNKINRTKSGEGDEYRRVSSSVARNDASNPTTLRCRICFQIPEDMYALQRLAFCAA